MPIHQSRYTDVYADGSHFLTKNFTPDSRVYGENVVTHKGIEYRTWNPRRSKLCAMLHKGTKFFPFRKESRILYLGAGSGTTASHISDIAVNGRMYFEIWLSFVKKERTCSPYWQTPIKWNRIICTLKRSISSIRI